MVQETVGWAKKVAVYECVCLFYIPDILLGTYEYAFQVVECVVTSSMSVLYNISVFLLVLAYIVANHKECCLNVVFTQHIDNPRGYDRYGAIVKGQIYGLLVWIHTPQCFGVQVTEYLRYLFYKHLINNSARMVRIFQHWRYKFPLSPLLYYLLGY